jgi:hypothetical protein
MALVWLQRQHCLASTFADARASICTTIMSSTSEHNNAQACAAPIVGVHVSSPSAQIGSLQVFAAAKLFSR